MFSEVVMLDKNKKQITKDSLLLYYPYSDARVLVAKIRSIEYNFPNIQYSTIILADNWRRNPYEVEVVTNNEIMILMLEGTIKEIR